MIDIINTLIAKETGEEDTFKTIEGTTNLSGIQSFNITTAPSKNDCDLTSSTITYTKQLILSLTLTANVTVVKTAIYRDDNCGRTYAKVHEGTCMTAKAIGNNLGALWTTTITAVLLDNEHNTVTTVTKTNASDGNFNVDTLLATLTKCIEKGKEKKLCTDVLDLSQC